MLPQEIVSFSCHIHGVSLILLHSFQPVPSQLIFIQLVSLSLSVDWNSKMYNWKISKMIQFSILRVFIVKWSELDVGQKKVNVCPYVWSFYKEKKCHKIVFQIGHVCSGIYMVFCKFRQWTIGQKTFFFLLTYVCAHVKLHMYTYVYMCAHCICWDLLQLLGFQGNIE